MMTTFPICEDILLVKNNNIWWISTILLCVLGLVVVAFLFHKPTSKIWIGKLMYGSSYINVGELIFPNHENQEIGKNLEKRIFKAAGIKL